MNVTKLIILSFLIFSFKISFAQSSYSDSLSNKINKNNIYINLGFVPVYGALNINYERLFKRTKKGFFKSYMAKLSGGYWISWISSGPHCTIGFSALTGSKSSHLETHIGISTMFNKSIYNDSVFDSQYNGDPAPKKIDYVFFAPSLSIGYRYQKPGSPLLLRLGISIPEATYIGLGICF